MVVVIGVSVAVHTIELARKVGAVIRERGGLMQSERCDDSSVGSAVVCETMNGDADSQQTRLIQTLCPVRRPERRLHSSPVRTKEVSLFIGGSLLLHFIALALFSWIAPGVSADNPEAVAFHVPQEAEELHSMPIDEIKDISQMEPTPEPVPPQETLPEPIAPDWKPVPETLQAEETPDKREPTIEEPPLERDAVRVEPQDIAIADLPTSTDWSRIKRTNTNQGTGSGGAGGSGVIGVGGGGLGNGTGGGVGSGQGGVGGAPVASIAPVSAGLSRGAHALKTDGGAYPSSARRKHHEGVVVVRVQIMEDGRVEKSEIVSSSGFEDLDEAALKAARDWRFEPALQDGQPVKSSNTIRIRYVLD